MIAKAKRTFVFGRLVELSQNPAYIRLKAFQKKLAALREARRAELLRAGH